MQKKEYNFSYEVFDSIEELNPEDAALLEKAKSMTQHAYAPYSRFRVGAVGRMENGQLVSGANQENASFPAGLCAEGVLLATASSLYPGVPITTIALSYYNEKGPSDRPISPCGICRQSLQEFEQRVGMPVRLLLGGLKGKIYAITQASQLLPFAFSGEELG